MDQFLENFKKHLSFELKSEQFLIDKKLKVCTHNITIGGRCLHCFKKDAPKLLKADASVFSKN